MKRRPLPPDGGLKEPKMKFEDTFSAQTVILESFFHKLTPEQQKAALDYRGNDC